MILVNIHQSSLFGTSMIQTHHKSFQLILQHLLSDLISMSPEVRWAHAFLLLFLVKIIITTFP